MTKDELIRLLSDPRVEIEEGPTLDRWDEPQHDSDQLTVTFSVPKEFRATFE